jgi:threonylcarbamoyladenosine tRNA methylthiotransferase MtaB
LVEELPFAYLHVFPYSDRPFTKASKMKPKVPPKVIKERVKLLKELGEKKRQQFRERMKGKTLRALVLGNGELLTENYITLQAPEGVKEGSIIKITL